MSRSYSATVVSLLGAFFVPILVAQETRLVAPPADGKPSAPAPPRVFPTFEVRSSLTHQLQEQQLTIQTVAPPSLPQPPKSSAKPLSEEELAEYRHSSEFQEFLATRKAEAANSPSELIVLSATIYDRDHTYLRWWHEGQAYEAWSNLDFNYLAGFAEFKSGKKRYGLIMGLGNATSLRAHRELPAPYPAVLQSKEAPAYQLVSGDQENAKALASIDALHQLYAAEEMTLIAATKGREKAQLAREADLKANPPQKPNIIIQVWPKEGSRHFQKSAAGKETAK